MARRKLGVRHRPARKQPLTIEEAEALDREALEGIGRMIGSGGIDTFSTSASTGTPFRSQDGGSARVNLIRPH